MSDLKADAALLLDKETITPADFVPLSRKSGDAPQSIGAIEAAVWAGIK